MKPLPSFDLHQPKTLSEALKLLRDLDDAKLLAGGTDLLLLLKDRTCKARNLVDLSLIEELTYIREAAGKIHIGATTTHSQIQSSDLIREKAPTLGEAATCVGSAQIRNLGTIGGNLCNASPAADTAPPLLALDSTAEIISENQSRSIPLTDLFLGPKVNSLKPFEILREVSFPVPPRGTGLSFQKLGRRKGSTLAIVNASAYIELDREVCRDVRMALGAVAPTPLRMIEAERLLRDQRLSPHLIEKAASLCGVLVSPVDDVRASADYRRVVSCVLMRRAITETWEKARRNTA